MNGGGVVGGQPSGKQVRVSGASDPKPVATMPDGEFEAPDRAAAPDGALITVCPDGPLLVRGSVRIVDAAGAVIPQNRPTIALCRCGKSQIAPLCDGTHKLLRTRDQPS